MIDSSEKRNRRLGSELQNSHVCEKCDTMVADIDIRRIIDGKTYTNLTKNTST